MKIFNALFVLSYFGLLCSAFTGSAQRQEPQLENNSIEIQHSQVGESHFLIFENLLTIPEQNYERFFNRMLYLYPVTKNIKHVADLNQIQLEFNQKLPEPDVLNQILQKFSIKQYSISSHD